MKRMPTTAKVTASRRRLSTTNFSALSPLIPARTLTSRPPRIAAVIERAQVLHVAKLARLGLSDEEVETMAGELSGILEHVDRIAALDLDDVEPTSHVVDLENV